MVVNEFFKSIFRTLGRIAAYIILAILAYLIFSWFGFESSKVKAQTLTPTTLTPYGINVGGQSYSATFYSTNTFSLNQVSGAYVYINGVSQTFNYALNNQTYLIDVVITFTTAFEDMPLTFQDVLTFNGVGATCDSTPNRSIIQTSASTNNYTYQYRFTCYIDNTTSGSSISYNWYHGRQQTIKNYTINFNLGSNDKENADIIAANNANTDRLINNQNYNTDRSIFNWNYNTDRIVTSNSQTQQAVNNNTQAIEDLEDSLTDESSASNILIQGVQGIIPDGPATQLLQLPFTMINSLYEGFNATCSAWDINTGPLLGNHVWTIPCINLARRLGIDVWSYRGFSLWQIIDIMGFIFMVYEIIMLMINGYNMIAELNDPWEVLYVPKYGGFNTRSGRHYVEY